MRVLQINANYGFGSTGLIVKDIGEAIEKNGGAAFFAYQRAVGEIKNGYKVGSIADWKAHALLSRLFGRQGYYSKGATKKLLAHIKTVKPDVVHLHNLHSNFVNINMLFKYLAKEDIPTVITMHDCWFFTGKCFHYVDCDCDRFSVGCGKCKKRKAPPKSMFFDFSASVLKNKVKRITDIKRLKLIGCSKWICAEAKKSLLKSCDTDYVYNGVDTEIFKPKDVKEKRDAICKSDELLVMGMANKWLLPSNVSIIKRVSEMSKVKLMLVGCTEEQLKLISEEYTGVIGVGFIKDRETLASYYNMADVFVNLTHADTLPTVNMESICCGTPVITYDSCGSPELVDEKTGIVVPENDSDGIISAISKVRDCDFSECADIGKEKFDKVKNYEKYIEIYEKIKNK